MITSQAAIDLRGKVQKRMSEIGIEIEWPIETHIWQVAGIIVMNLRLREGSAQRVDAITARASDIAVAAGIEPRIYNDPLTHSIVAEFQLVKPPTLYTSMLLGSGQPYNMTIGRDVSGNPLYIDISNSATPHILVAGTTGAGKTAMCHNALATIARATPRLKVLSYDPAHPGFPWLMPHIKSNLIEAVATPGRLLDRLSKLVELIESGGSVPGRVLIYIDEVRDLIQAEPRIVEPLTRIAQRGRQAGMHLMCATQNPSRKSLPPDLLTNLPARVVLAVADRAQSDMASGNQKIDAHKLTKPAGVLVADGGITRFVSAMPDDYAAMNDLGSASAAGVGQVPLDIHINKPAPDRRAIHMQRDFALPAPVSPKGEDMRREVARGLRKLDIWAEPTVPDPNRVLQGMNFILPASSQTVDAMPTAAIAPNLADYTLEDRIRAILKWNPGAAVTAICNVLRPGGAQNGFHAVTEIVNRVKAEQE